MTTITRQQLIRDFTNLLKTRGLRLAALGGTGASSDWYSVYTPSLTVALTAPTSDVYRIVIDMNKAKLDALDERATGSEYNIPVPDRV